MSGIRFHRLVDQFVRTLETLSATVIRERERDDIRPARFRVVTGEGQRDCILFLWAVTPGGGGADVRPANERRIQMTKVSGIPLEPGKRTLLGGWSDEYGVWSFWDPRRHVQFSRKSPSIQVTSGTLESAQARGIATYIRPAASGPEVVVAVHPDSLLWYVQNGLGLHNADSDATGVASLVDASTDDERHFLDESTTEIQASRRFDLVNIMRGFRDAKFRPAVLRAYRYQCAVCGMALKLVDAAHIIPVSYPQSTDEITNGLALCRSHHGAYDNGLLGVRSDFSLMTNPKRESSLEDFDLDMGLDSFKAALPAKIAVPMALEARPLPMNLVVGLQARGWPPEFVS